MTVNGWTRPTCNIENMKLFIAELRSGRRQQGYGKLGEQLFHVSSDGCICKEKPVIPLKLCCLGVACELAIKCGVPVERFEEASDIGQVTVLYGGQKHFLPYSVMKWLGIGSLNPELVAFFRADGTPVTRTAAALNDGEAIADYPHSGYMPRMDFLQIADAFERTYIGEVA